MRRLEEQVKKELMEVEEQGININNLDTTGKLVDILKDLTKIKKEEIEMQEYRGDYGRMDYGRRGVPGSGRGRYSGDNRMKDYLDRAFDGIEMYEYGKERSRYGHGEDERIYEGLEKIMSAVCMFVECAMDFAETPEEKEIIHKHLSKMSRI